MKINEAYSGICTLNKFQCRGKEIANVVSRLGKEKFEFMKSDI